MSAVGGARRRQQRAVRTEALHVDIPPRLTCAGNAIPARDWAVLPPTIFKNCLMILLRFRERPAQASSAESIVSRRFFWTIRHVAEFSGFPDLRRLPVDQRRGTHALIDRDAARFTLRHAGLSGVTEGDIR